MKRPGTGLSPRFLDMVVGKVARRSIKKDDLIRMEDF